MYNRKLTKLVLFVLSFAALNFVFCRPLLAAEEGEDLLLYFSEDELVETPTRAPKPLIRVAENVTIISAKEIESLNAHNLAEVLQRVSGLFTSFVHMDFGGQAKLRTHGLQTNHILMLLDGVRLNNTSGGDVLLEIVPVHIIKRIEIIKGPASSTWGSALGGVVNVITKDTGSSATPKGTVSGSYGEAETLDGFLDIVGENYYFNANEQESDSLRGGRDFENEQYYGKIDLELPEGADFYLTMGQTNPEFKWGDFWSYDYSYRTVNNNTFGSANFDVQVTRRINFHAAVQLFKQVYFNEKTSLGQTFYGPRGDLIDGNMWDEQAVTSEAKLDIQLDRHSIVLGAELIRGEMDYTERNGLVWQSFGFPASFEATKYEERWGMFVNDTWQLDTVIVNSGVRYDHHSISKSFVSPSLGVVVPSGNESIFRVTAGRGFAYPWLTTVAVDSPILAANPDLEPEEIYSLQGGYETNSIPFLYLKTSLFHHWVKDTWVTVTLPSWLLQTQNFADSERTGLEITLKTEKFYHVSAEASYAYVYKHFESDLNDDDQYEVNLGLSYDDDLFRAKLMGRYLWWDWTMSSKDDVHSYQYTDYSHMIWDLFFGVKPFTSKDRAVEIFGSVRNLFNGSHYWDEDYINPGRWVEAGVRIEF